ncbi:MAG: BCCT family transporter [Proteobacteria bacterium]|nr:BCCT family transporter [Pseudomonadota bacterium]
MADPARSEPPVDWPVFGITALTVIAVCALIFAAPDRAGTFINGLYDQLTRTFGFLYQWYVIALLIFLATSPSVVTVRSGSAVATANRTTARSAGSA